MGRFGASSESASLLDSPPELPLLPCDQLRRDGQSGADAGTRTPTYRLQDAPSSLTMAATSGSMSTVIVLVVTPAAMDVSSPHKWCYAGAVAVIYG